MLPCSHFSSLSRTHTLSHTCHALPCSSSHDPLPQHHRVQGCALTLIMNDANSEPFSCAAHKVEGTLDRNELRRSAENRLRVAVYYQFNTFCHRACSEKMLCFIRLCLGDKQAVSLLAQVTCLCYFCEQAAFKTWCYGTTN